MKEKVKFILVCLSVITGLFSACQESSLTPEEISQVEHFLSLPALRFDNYDFDPQSSLPSRVNNDPDGIVRSYISDIDGRDYQYHTPTEAEMLIIMDSISNISPLNQKVIYERVVGIYIVDDFWGSGMADNVYDENGKIYVSLFFNSATLSSNLTDWMTYKEKTCFYSGENDVDIKVIFDGDIPAFEYILAHETTHAVDYIYKISPYVQPITMNMELYFGKEIDYENEYCDGVWASYFVPEDVYDSENREKITYYGFGKGPLLSMDDARDVYEDLSLTPFVSLYGWQNWAEDLAESYSIYQLTQIRGFSCIIEVYELGELVYSYEPAENPIIKSRMEYFNKFYSEEEF